MTLKTWKNVKSFDDCVIEAEKKIDVFKIKKKLPMKLQLEEAKIARFLVSSCSILVSQIY